MSKEVRRLRESAQKRKKDAVLRTAIVIASVGALVAWVALIAR